MYLGGLVRKFIRIVTILSLSVPAAFGSEQTDSYRAHIRTWVMAHEKQDLETIAPLDNDQAANLVDELRLTNLARMEEAKLLQAHLENGPWSGSYWPVYAGEIANRYGDEKYPADEVWKDNVTYLESVLGKGTNAELSPAEKYDMLLGDSTFTLTQKMIHAGAPYVDREGTVPTWFGICHGWAPASLMEPRPLRSVKTVAADGQELQFSPADLKALASLLWANGAGEVRFIGGRCNSTTVNRDRNHRETDPDCFDTNPATWHLAIVNQIGVAKRGFVADVSPGDQVWNQPAYGYSYLYANSITGVAGHSLAEAKVRLADWHNDPFSATRSASAVYVVKINMAFEYGSETAPTQAAEDNPSLDAHANQNYVYDLELDANDEIVGGEWYSTAHPDFLWVPAKGSKASSAGDAMLDQRGDHSSWNLGAPLPKSWKAAGRYSAENEQPLARIVEQLLKASNGSR